MRASLPPPRMRAVVRADERDRQCGRCRRPAGVRRLASMQTTAGSESDAMGAWFADELLAVATCPDPDRGVPAMVERSARAGQMGPLHRRDETETYRVLEGEVS